MPQWLKVNTVKQGKNSPFLGCTNYTPDGKGCNRMMTNKEYNDIINQTKS